MSYVDGFVLAVPEKNLADYKRMARKAGKVWREHGALEYIVFSWIVYKSRRDRDRINKLVMSDPRLADMMDPKSLPFDGKRMFWGGFKKIVENP
jgi:uncharacterized protein YbaA (DUF1428 family)